jgi:hypothetical protein
MPVVIDDPGKQNSAGQSVMLTCHPATVCTAVRSMRVEVHRNHGALELQYQVEGEFENVLVPLATASRRTHELWQHTCFEAFIRRAGSEAYIELNFSPSGEWAIYRFTGYRQSMMAVESTAPRIGVHREGGMLRLDAVVELEALHELPTEGALELALSAVIEESNRRLSYWGLVHPTTMPDFHHDGGFVMRVG